MHPLLFVRILAGSWLRGVKKPPGKFIKKGVSFDPSLHEDATARAKQLGFQNFSAYIVALVHCDLNAPDGWLKIPPKKK
jgi:hypothetical protein